jgi:ribosomal protein L28
MGDTFLKMQMRDANIKCETKKQTGQSPASGSTYQYNRNRGFCKPCAGRSRARNNSRTRKIWKFGVQPLAFWAAEQ